MNAPARRTWMRTWMLGAAGLAATGAGAWWGWQRRAGTPAATSSSSDPQAAQALAAFWGRSFNTVSGASLSPQAFQGRPLVLNFWATWCPPCVREMPELDRFARTFGAKGWQVLGLAVDQAEAVQGFLQKTPVSFPVALAGLDGLSLVRELGNSSGGLPFTVLISGQGDVIQRKMGATSFDELSAWAGA